MSINIVVKEDNTVEIFDTEAEHGLPFIRQPQWPNGTAWASADEARSWAEMCVEAIQDENAPFAPLGPGLERQAKPTAEEIAARQAERRERNNAVEE